MTEQSKDLLARFPVRKSRAQKAAFRDWLIHTLETAGYSPKTEESCSLAVSHNVIAGDPDTVLEEENITLLCRGIFSLLSR